MARRPCPACDLPTATQLDPESHNAGGVDYFVCDDCGHIWAAAKGNGSLVTNITPLINTKHQPG